MEKEPLSHREQLIATAMTFLENPSVRRSAFDQKRKFLQSKGLTEEEINIACDRAGIFVSQPDNKKHTVLEIGTYRSSDVVTSQKSLIQRIKEAVQTVAIGGGLLYLIYRLCKKYLESIIFGGRKRSTEEIVQVLEVKVDEYFKNMDTKLNKIEDEYAKCSFMTLSKELQSLKTEVDTVKGLLLNRKQFVSPISQSPSWQLTSRGQQCNNEVENDTGSGSGSSETEIVTKNSDSSLEIM